MSKEDIIEGLKAAIGKGEPLDKAMISFYNSGYPKEDIEDSALGLTSPRPPVTFSTTQPVSTSKTSFLGKILKKPQPAQSQSQSVQPQYIYEPVKRKESELQKPGTKEPEYSSEKATYEEYPSEEEAVYQEYPPLQKQQTTQKVSQYGVKPSPVGTLVVFILVFFLLFLIGVLVSVFLFKDNLAAFFNSFIK